MKKKQFTACIQTFSDYTAFNVKAEYYTEPTIADHPFVIMRIGNSFTTSEMGPRDIESLRDICNQILAEIDQFPY